MRAKEHQQLSKISTASLLHMVAIASCPMLIANQTQNRAAMIAVQQEAARGHDAPGGRAGQEAPAPRPPRYTQVPSCCLSVLQRVFGFFSGAHLEFGETGGALRALLIAAVASAGYCSPSAALHCKRHAPVDTPTSKHAGTKGRPQPRARAEPHGDGSQPGSCPPATPCRRTRRRSTRGQRSGAAARRGR